MKSPLNLIIKIMTDQLRWKKPRSIVGGRTSISSVCGRFCITKKDGIYQPMKLKGALWVRLAPSSDILEAKGACNA